jgi:hypothetical protein
MSEHRFQLPASERIFQLQIHNLQNRYRCPPHKNTWALSTSQGSLQPVTGTGPNFSLPVLLQLYQNTIKHSISKSNYFQAGRGVQVAEGLPSNLKAPRSNPSTTKKKKNCRNNFLCHITKTMLTVPRENPMMSDHWSLTTTSSENSSPTVLSTVFSWLILTECWLDAWEVPSTLTH